MGREKSISAQHGGTAKLLSILLYVSGYVVLVLSQAPAPGDEDFGSIVDALPPGFILGTATSAYQVEGAVEEDGRGQTIWDVFSHMEPPKITNDDNGDVSCDHYHRYEEDADLAKGAGFRGFRLSLAWSRIYPDGEGDEPNREGIQHYHDVLDAIIERGLEPLVTLYHWDLPQALEERYGGWLSPAVVGAFESYADTCFREFGGKVKHWLTMNEPCAFVYHGYSTGFLAPGRCSDRNVCAQGDSFREPYKAAHNVILAHARAVSLYRRLYKLEQGGSIAMTLNMDWAEPLDPESHADKDSAQRYLEFQLGWFADPVYFGDYPASMRERVGDRLPQFSDQDRALVLGSNDFFGLNHYTTGYCTDIPDHHPPLAGTSPAKAREAGIMLPRPSENDGWVQDSGLIQTKTDLHGNLNGWESQSSWLTAVPSGFRHALKWVSDRYGGPPILVTENGFDIKGESKMNISEALQDRERIDYFDAYLRSMVQAMVEDHVDVRGYYAWSLLDNFEWVNGYSARFGITYVDFDHNQQRTPKDSYRWFTRLTQAYEAAPASTPPPPKGEGDGDADPDARGDGSEVGDVNGESPDVDETVSEDAGGAGDAGDTATPSKPGFFSRWPGFGFPMILVLAAVLVTTWHLGLKFGSGEWTWRRFCSRFSSDETYQEVAG